VILGFLENLCTSDVEIRLRFERPKNHCVFHERGFWGGGLKLPVWLWDPLSLLFTWYHWLSAEVKQPGCEPDHLYLLLRLRMCGAYLPFPICVCGMLLH